MITQHAYITIEHFGYALSDEQKAIKHQRIYNMVRKQLDLEPDDEYYMFHYLTICLAMGKYEEAREAVAQLNIDRLRPELRVKAYYKAAQVELRFNMYQKARAYIRHALLLAPDAAFLHYLLSNILYQMQRFSAGIRSAYRALDFSKEKSNTTTLIYLPIDECLANLGIGYLLSKNYEEAERYFRDALEHNPDNTTAIKYRNWIKKNVGDIEPGTRSDSSTERKIYSYPS